MLEGKGSKEPPQSGRELLEEPLGKLSFANNLATSLTCFAHLRSCQGREELAQREANEQRERIDRSEAVAAPSEPRSKWPGLFPS